MILILTACLSMDPAPVPAAVAAQETSIALPAIEELVEQTDLPDPFLNLKGERITHAHQWPARAAELRELFRHFVYGYTPPASGVVARKVSEVQLLGGRAVLSEVELSFAGLPDAAPKLLLALVLPVGVGGEAPVFLALNKCGNHTVHWDEGFTIPEREWRHPGCAGTPEHVRGKAAAFWCLELLIERGYGLATFCGDDIDPDRDDFTDGIHPWYPDLQGEDRWGTIAAWSWGLSRTIDYLETDARVDPDRIALLGHSRRGKTALLTAAMDRRVALVVPHQSGTGGCALSRDNGQETVERINTSFPHWFNDTFQRFNGREVLLPVDQHLLVALVAPRPMIETVGLQDRWANYESSLVGLRAAAPVWELLGTRGMVGEGVLGIDDEVAAGTTGRLLQYRLDTPHVLNADYWNAILNFADLHLEPAGQ